MWLEAIIARDDFLGFAIELLPLRVRLGPPDSHHYLLLTRPTDVSLVANRGLRLRCNVQIRWPVLHIDVPIDVEDVTVLVEPSVANGSGKLDLALTIEHADIAFIPSIVDKGIVHAVNDAVAKKSDELCWDFARTLTHDFALPSLFETVNGIGVEVLWGKVRTSEEAMVLAVSFHATALRDDGKLSSKRAQPAPLARRAPDAVLARSGFSIPTAVVTALSLAVAYVTARMIHRLVRHAA